MGVPVLLFPSLQKEPPAGQNANFSQLGDTQYIFWSMDPDRGFLDVSKEKKTIKEL